MPEESAINVEGAQACLEVCRFGFFYMLTLQETGYDGFKLLEQSTSEALRYDNVDCSLALRHRVL